MNRPAPWSDTENQSVIELYFAMLAKAKDDRAYNKAAMIRYARGEDHITDLPAGLTVYVYGELSNRSRGSIEAKLMNVTACHRDLYPGDVTMDGFGYKAAPNYQASLKKAVNETLNTIHDRLTA